MKLYHGTPERNARSIEVEGFYGSELTDFTVGNAGDVVFVTTDISEAREYGDAIFEIGYVTLVRMENSQTETEGYVTLEDLNENGCWQRIE